MGMISDFLNRVLPSRVPVAPVIDRKAVERIDKQNAQVAEPRAVPPLDDDEVTVVVVRRATRGATDAKPQER